ncbi:MAG TPA: hypothetical protein VH621_00950, partial [Nitrososphaera sp.]
MKDFKKLLKLVRPYRSLFELALFLMTLVGLFEAGRTALLRSIIDSLPKTERQAEAPVTAIEQATGISRRTI